MSEPGPFADALRRLRKARGLTLRALGGQVGVSHVSVVHWENGAACPALSTLCRLADVLECSLDELCGRTKGE